MKPSLIQMAGKQPMIACSVFDACLVSLDKLKKVHKAWKRANQDAETKDAVDGEHEEEST